jgi:hypothetical protein
MDYHAQDMQCDHFSERDPFVSVAELESRLKYARKVEAYIQTVFHDDFHLRAEHVAVILLVSLKTLAPGGSLSAETVPRGRPRAQSDVKSTLNCLRMFCKHCKSNSSSSF